MAKIVGEDDVYVAASKRLDIVFKNFTKIYVCFSGGKDSGVLLNMALAKAHEYGRLPLDVLFIDLEAQYQHTMDYVEDMLSRPDVRVHWICLPLHLRNAVSQMHSHWLCWDPDKKDAWVRPLPKHPGVIADPAYFNFFRKGMEFEEFITCFAEWFSDGDEKTACLVGIRSDESLRRYLTIKNKSKRTFQGHGWSTAIGTHTYNFYPLYDWKTEDVWVANSKLGFKYNRIYDLMYLAGVPLGSMRLCQPYGDDQRKSLYLFKLLEPDTWGRVVARVEGANFGNRYAGNRALGNRKVVPPPGYTYKQYAKFLLDTMPPYMSAHYRLKIRKFLNWHRKHAHETGYTSIPDTADPKLEAAKKAPSWRRVCKVLLRNDYWCTGLSFGPTKREHERQLEAALQIKQNPLEI